MLELKNPTTSKQKALVLEPLSTPVAAVSKAASDWYLERVTKARTKPFAEIVTITPEIAELLLQVNEKNRNVNGPRLAEITKDITAGNFRLNGESIIISRDGLLNDGQHRLTAVVDTGMSIQSVVVFGVERDSRLTVDTGTARTAGNFIAMEGGQMVNIAAPVSFWLIMHKANQFNNTGRTTANIRIPTKSEVVAYYLQHKDEIDDGIRFCNRKNAKELRCFGALAVAYILLHRANAKAADDFFERLLEGAGFDIGSPIHVLRTKLISMQGTTLKPNHRVAVIIRAWNYWRKGAATIRSFQLPTEYPKIEA